jgi:FkbM family methyltransferase
MDTTVTFRGNIEVPSAANRVTGLTRIEGWCHSSAGPIMSAAVECQGIAVGELFLGRPRPDVEAAFPGPWSEDAGFVGVFDLGAFAGTSSKNVDLSVLVVDSEKNSFEFDQPIVVSPPPPVPPASVASLDQGLFRWLNEPAFAGGGAPHITIAAFQSAIAVGLSSELNDIEGGRLAVADRLQRLWEEGGDDAFPEALLRRVWLPDSGHTLTGLPVGWIDSLWGRRLLLWLRDDSGPCEPYEPPLTWFALALHWAVSDVRHRFPDPVGADRTAYVHWLATEAPDLLAVPARLTRSLADDIRRTETRPSPRSTRQWADASKRDGTPTFEVDPFSHPPRWDSPAQFAAMRDGWPRAIESAGMNIVGHFRTNSGLAEATRSTLRSAGGTGYDVSALDLGPTDRAYETEQWRTVDSSCRYDINILHDNVFHAPTTMGVLGRRFLLDRYNIGFWYWELAELPAAIRPNLEFVDELWVASEFTAAAFRPHTAAAVTVVPPALDPRLALAAQAPPSRSRFDLPEGRFLFLVMASASSVIGRKNPTGALDAFVRAFDGPERAEVGLVLKITGLDHAPALRARIAELASDFSIFVIDEVLSRDDTIGLLRCTDALVSLHRGEGFGLPLAEAMSLGKPVVTTGYSGNMDFTNDETALLVDFTLTEIGPGQGVYPADLVWADPDLDDAARQLRLVFADDALRTRIAAAGRDAILRRYTAESAREVIVSRLEKVPQFPSAPLPPSPTMPTGGAPPASPVRRRSSMMISYSQNHEDVLLERCFGGQETGFYIDVGAWDPVQDSVTHHFYSRGWSGINVEPVTKYFERLQVERPRDINLQYVIGDHVGKHALSLIEDSGLSTTRELDQTFIDDLDRSGFTSEVIEVDGTTLADLCDQYVPDGTEIDFLKVDVEGAESAVIRGADWERYRPRVLMIEATRPLVLRLDEGPPALEDASLEWEPQVLGSGYLLAATDGLNRFYVREQDADLLEHFAVPVNVTDLYLPHATWVATQETATARQELDAVREELALANQVGSELEQRLQDVDKSLAEIRTSHSWRVTAPLRALTDWLRKQ